MVNYVEAIKKPFQDITTLAIGTVLSIIPLVSLLVAGYGVGVGRNTVNGDNKLPKFEVGQIVPYIKDLVFVVIISIIYLIPAGIVLAIGAASLIGSLVPALAGGGSAAGLTALSGAIAAGGAFILLGLLLGILGWAFAEIGILAYAKEGSLGAAFNVGGVAKKVLSLPFWITAIVLGIYMVVLVVVLGILSLVPIIGTIVGTGLVSYLMTVTSYTMFGEVFRETQ